MQTESYRWIQEQTLKTARSLLAAIAVLLTVASILLSNYEAFSPVLYPQQEIIRSIVENDGIFFSIVYITLQLHVVAGYGILMGGLKSLLDATSKSIKVLNPSELDSVSAIIRIKNKSGSEQVRDLEEVVAANDRKIQEANSDLESIYNELSTVPWIVFLGISLVLLSSTLFPFIYLLDGVLLLRLFSEIRKKYDINIVDSA